MLYLVALKLNGRSVRPYGFGKNPGTDAGRFLILGIPGWCYFSSL
jgi:hypothetical protein